MTIAATPIFLLLTAILFVLITLSLLFAGLELHARIVSHARIMSDAAGRQLANHTFCRQSTTTKTFVVLPSARQPHFLPPVNNYEDLRSSTLYVAFPLT